MQKAVSMLSTLTVSTLTALGPFAIFSMQFIEGRIEYSALTITGLAIYVTGALLAALGSVRAARQKNTK